MFTGLIEEVGRIRALTLVEGSGTIAIDCATVVEDAAHGDSIAVNGVCLTVTELPADGGFVAEMMGETLDRTALGDIQEGSPVNLERAMRADARLGGHMVQGHVDGVGSIVAIEPHDEWTTITYSIPEGLGVYIVEKGSITIDGTSLTVMDVTESTFSVGLIPHTMDVTIHGDRQVGDRVNLEVDVIAKYVQKQVAAQLAGHPALRSATDV